MYGIVEISGHQYKVKAGDILDVQKLDKEEGQTVDLDRVLFVGGESPSVGSPLVEGAVVKAKVIKNDRSRKLLVFKRRPGKWQKRRGHRQSFTSLLITEIFDGSGQTSQIDAESEVAKKFKVNEK